MIREFVRVLQRATGELSSLPWGCYKFGMAFNPLDWFRSSAAGAPAEPRKQFVAGLVVWVLAWLVVWWIQDKRVAMSVALSSRQAETQKAIVLQPLTSSQTAKKVDDVAEEDSSKASTVSWLGTFLAMGLFWGGGLLIYRPLTGWGFFLSWLRRCQTVERLALISAAALTLSAIVLHWMWSIIDAWMLAAVVAALILASAFGWKLPGKKQL